LRPSIDGKVGGIRLPTLTEQQLRDVSASLGRRVDSPPETRTVEDVGLRVAHMDQLGIDVQVLHNTLLLSPITERPETEVALTRSWNRWMADVWAQAGGRLRWTCVVPTLDLDAARKELREAREHGAVGMCIRPYEHNLLVTDPYFHPLFEECQDLDLPVVVHVGNGSAPLLDAIQTACFSYLSCDLPRRFPTLRWGFIEVSAGWVPWLLHNLWRRGALPEGEAFEANRLYVTTQMDDDHGYLLDYLGPNVMMIGTDYGHIDVSSEIDAIESFRRLPTLDDAVKSCVLSANPQRFYGL
jgi:predicted TIM-barrel fold metal-dependent hydrolase